MKFDITLEQLVEQASKDNEALRLLKMVGVKAKEYGFASDIRELETKLFPMGEHLRTAQELEIMFRLAGFNVNPQTAFFFYQLCLHYENNQETMGVKEVVAIKHQVRKLFNPIQDKTEEE